MDASLKPDVRKFIEEQVESGRFSSADDVLDEALRRMMLDMDLEIDEGAIGAISRAEEQLDRGEGRDFEEFAAAMRKRFVGPKGR
jgi:putative addiction module CopG family antidote